MQKSAELLSALRELTDETKAQIRRMDDPTLKALAASLPSKAPPGTAEMLMLILVYREIESRSRQYQDTNVLPFPQQAER